MSTQNKTSARVGCGRLVRRRLYAAGYKAGRRNTPFAFVERKPANYISGWAAGQNFLHWQWRPNTETSQHPRSGDAGHRTERGERASFPASPVATG